MMMWFIVAIVYVAGDNYYTRMQEPFMTKELCQKFYQSSTAVRDDVMKLYPNQTGHTLVCLTEEQVQELIKEVRKTGEQV